MTYEINKSAQEGIYMVYKSYTTVFVGTLADCYAWIQLDKMSDAIFIY